MSCKSSATAGRTEVTKAYNRRKERDHAFCGDPYHATAAEAGEYLCASFIEEFKPADFSRKQTEIVEAGGGAWALREAAAPYGLKTGPKNAAKALWRRDSGTIRL